MGVVCQYTMTVAVRLAGKELLGEHSLQWVILVVDHVFKPGPIAIC